MSKNGRRGKSEEEGERMLMKREEGKGKEEEEEEKSKINGVEKGIGVRRKRRGVTRGRIEKAAMQ